MGSLDAKIRRRADGTLATEELPELFEVVVQRRYAASRPRHIEYSTEPLGAFLRRNWLGLDPDFGTTMCELTWPG